MRPNPFLVFLSLWLATATAFGAISAHTEANVMVELTFTAQRAYNDPFNQVQLDVVFIDPSGRELRVPAFWDGGSVWKARYASPLVGTHIFRTECSEVRDAGLNGVKGKVEVAAYSGKNPLYMHGPLRVSANRRYLEHFDGTPFFWLGDTWWMGLSRRLHWPNEFQELTADRVQKGFTVVQLVAGLYPDMFPFDPRGANEAGYPWQTNYTAIRPEYFDAADRRIFYLVDQGLTPCIVGAWGYFMPWMGVEKMKAHWRNLIARYGALPVVWCAAGEANLPWYLAKGFPYDDREQVHKWTEVLRYIRATDPWHRPLTLHPTGIGPLTARHSTDDPTLLDFDMLQTPHGRQEAVPITVQTVRNSYAATPTMPVIDGEASYEMLGDSLPTEWTRRMFWLCMMNGAAGHTYGANGIWQNNRPGDPHGKSPHGGTYGKIPWNVAMHLPGSQQVAYGKKFFEQFPWQDLRPVPNGADWAAGSLSDAAWIWYPEGNPAVDAPAARRLFQRTFVIPPGIKTKAAQLRVSADDQFTASLNGVELGSGADWSSPRQFENLVPRLKPGTNTIEIIARNMPFNGANPAGMIAALQIDLAGTKAIRIVSDSNWFSEKLDSPEDTWTNAMIAARYGGGPWGAIDSHNDSQNSPLATGIPGVVRIIYAPRTDSLHIRELGPATHYDARYFDPVGGGTTPIGVIESDKNGNWTCRPPAGINHDWVVVLERKKDHAQSSPKQMTLSNNQLAWSFDWNDGHLHSTWLENKLTGHRFALSDGQELSLGFSSKPDRIDSPILVGNNDFEIISARQENSQSAVFQLSAKGCPARVTLHAQLEGATRRKWIDVTNVGENDLLLLDINLDDFTVPALTEGGGNGKPVFFANEVFAAIEHPIGVNTQDKGRVRLSYYPGKRIPAVMGGYVSHAAVVGVTAKDAAPEQFVSWLAAKTLRPKKFLSVYTPFGINNQWGACPTLDDEETLDVLGLVQKFQAKGVHLDYFTLDTGWVDPDSDLTRFRPTCYPDGPGAIVDRVNSLGMKFGLWFGTSWATQSCWQYAPAFAPNNPPGLPWRDGSPLTAGGINFCFASEPYFSIFKNAVLYHVRNNKVRLLKFDGGNYYCDSTDHGHLPGKYSVAPMYDNLIDVANSARAIAPDVFIIWYWGVGSPFWTLYGDMVFESGLEMEGSGTSSFPTLYYRDSVTLAQDQNAQFASTIPPVTKDSLGVWLADSRWGNFMGKERWREGLVMDLGRGSMLFPNLWGDLYQLNDDDIAFLHRMEEIAHKNESLFLHRQLVLGDPAWNHPYGYAYREKNHAFFFLNNDNFSARHVDLPFNIDTQPGTTLHVISHFPEASRLLRPDGAPFKTGDTLDLWLRPFEVLMLEVSTASIDKHLPLRSVSDQQADQLGRSLPLHSAPHDSSLDIRFADAATFATKHFKPSTQSFSATLPDLGEEQSILAVAVRLRRGDDEWKYAPDVEQIVQPILRIDRETAQMVPVPDARQFGNTQSFGCSWVVYKIRLPKRWSGKSLQLALHSWLPDGVQARAEAWVVQHWWHDEARPSPDGYYTDAPQ